MSKKLISGWALGAMLVAAGVLGYILGQQTSDPDQKQAPPTQPPGQAYEATEQSDRAEPVEPIYRVPESLRDIPRRWRSPIADEPSGYAVVFEPERRSMIIEECEHLGYQAKNLVGPLGMPCEVLLRGQLASLRENEAMLLERSRERTSVGLDLDVGGQTPVLTLRIESLDIELVPGSRNDLLQDMEALPRIQEQKRAYLRAKGQEPADLER